MGWSRSLLTVVLVLVLVGHCACNGLSPITKLPQNGTSSSFRGQGAEPGAIIAILRTRELIATRFRHVCAVTPKQKEKMMQSQSPAVTTVRPHDLPPACWRLQGACQRVFQTTLAGVAGHFNHQQVKDLKECAGATGIVYIMKDHQVKKAEGDDHMRWWTYRAPTNMTLQQLQQLVATKLGTAAAAGVASGMSQLNSSKGSKAASRAGTSRSRDNPPKAHASAGPVHSSAGMDPAQFAAGLVQRWLVAELGLAAQKELSQPSVQQAMSVRAADGVPEVVLRGVQPPEVTTAAADANGGEASVSSQPRGSKNQDPGIAVDPHAVARPDIIVRTSSDDSSADSSSSSRSAAAKDLQQPLSLDAAERANKAPGIKEQRLVTALWNLDRIDQRELPLSTTFSYGSPRTAGTGKGVTIYMLDSGIRTTHQEFQPWDGSSGSRAMAGPDFVDNDGVADDCDGHGTHVASTAAGRSVGIAKEAQIVAVRVLDCDGSGSISNVVAGLDWVAQHAVKPAVVSLSLGVPAGNWSKPMEDSIRHITDVVGIPVVVASGNSAKDSCEVAPARVPTAITVAASNVPTKFAQTRAGDVEDLYSWSNTGACVKLFAPGVDVYGACGGTSRCAVLDDKSYTWASGTSMAAPHVAGAAAVLLESRPTATPSEVLAALVGAASSGRLTDPSMLPGTPNKLLFTLQQ